MADNSFNERNLNVVGSRNVPKICILFFFFLRHPVATSVAEVEFFFIDIPTYFRYFCIFVFSLLSMLNLNFNTVFLRREKSQRRVWKTRSRFDSIYIYIYIQGWNNLSLHFFNRDNDERWTPVKIMTLHDFQTRFNEEILKEVEIARRDRFQIPGIYFHVWIRFANLHLKRSRRVSSRW